MRLPEEESTWQLLISVAMLLCSIFLFILAEAKHRQSLEMLKEVREIQKTIKEVCK